MSKSTFANYEGRELEAAVQSMKRLVDVFRHELDLDIFLTWGTLLGAVREGDFISFDNDIDIAYLSRREADFEIAEEHEVVVRVLLEADFPVLRNSKGQIHVQVRPEDHAITGNIFNLDLWTTWTRDGKFYHYPDIKGEVRDIDVAPLREQLFKGETFLVPANPDAVLTHFYGPDWRTPDPNYAWYPRYDVDDEFEFLRTRPYGEVVPEYPLKAANLEIEPAGDHFLVSSSSLEAQRLNATGIVVLELCTGRNSVTDIILALQSAYQLPSAPEVVVLDFLSDARAKGMITGD